MKPGTFTQVYIHLVIAVKFRECLLLKEFREEVFRYLGGIVTESRNKLLIVNGYLDHVHIFLSLNPDEKISDLVGNLKRSSTLFINNKHWLKTKFQWQDGYGAFSYSKSQINNVFNYIANQELHHGKKTFREEYIALLKNYEIKYDEKYIFDFFE